MFKHYSLLFALLSSSAYADRYGVHDSYSSGVGGLFDFLLAIGCIIFSIRFLSDSYSSWKLRQSTDEKIVRENIVISVLGYLLVAFFLAVPVMLFIKFFGGVQAAKDYWLGITATLFCVVTFLRQT